MPQKSADEKKHGLAAFSHFMQKESD